jgi:DNA helicase-2/ATP-dependent DNA helicase PcrA
MVTAMLERSGLVRHFETEKEGRERLENLRELVNAAAAFVADEGLVLEAPANLGVAGASIDESGEIFSSPLSMFLAHASLEAGDNQASEGQDAVQLMTIHSAKGLEFNVVFITGLEEGLFPHENSLSELDGLEEERRLMYVAITRARRRLYISLAQTRMLHGQTRYNMRSRFLDELPEGSLKWLAPRVAQRTAPSFGTRDFGSSRSTVSSFDPDAPMHAKRVSADTPYMGGPARLTGQTHDSGFRVGQAVSHARFGEGVITALEGSGQDARAQVQFKRAGSKWLALSVAKLDRV